jgi:hypothetical protein
MPTKDRIQQVKTTKERHGDDHYKKIGKKGGDESPTKFDSERGMNAANIRWQKFRELKLKEQEGKKENEQTN